MQDFIFLTWVIRSSYFLKYLLHLLAKSIMQLRYEAYINISCMYSQSTYCKSIFSIHLFNQLFDCQWSLYLYSCPGVPLLRYCLYWSHNYYIIVFIFLNQCWQRFWKWESWKSQICKKISILIELCIHEVLTHLYKYLSTYHGCGGGNGWNYLTCLELNLMMSDLINGVIFSSVVWEECYKVYMAIAIIIFLKFYLLYLCYWVLLDFLLNLVKQFNNVLHILLTWAVFILFTLI